MKFSSRTKTAVEKMISVLNLQVVRSSNYQTNMNQLSDLQNKRFSETRNGFLFQFLQNVTDSKPILQNLSESKAQLLQDLFVLDRLSWKRNGYFVEFGATDGISLSNTYLLEKHFGWNGLLAEPGKNWHLLLEANRQCTISKLCIWKSSGDSLSFLESEYPEFSTIQEFKNHDGMRSSRKAKATYEVETVTLFDFLKIHDAPKDIDYISIDTEGSEYEILREFPFDVFRFQVLTVEHNHSENETKIDSLLSKNGYDRVLKEISQFDGWYIRRAG